jgi:hypothetical protein
VNVRVLRNGRQAAQAVAELRSESHDGPALHLTATFGAQNESPIDYVDATFPDVPGPAQCDPPPPRPPDSPFQDLASTSRPTGARRRGGIRETWTSQPAETSCWTRFVKEPRSGRHDRPILPIPADMLGPAIGQRIGPNPFFVLTLRTERAFSSPPRHRRGCCSTWCHRSRLTVTPADTCTCGTRDRQLLGRDPTSAHGGPTRRAARPK